MTTPHRDHDLALLAAGHDTGFWDEHGRPAPWPDDIDEWRPATSEPITLEPANNPTNQLISKDQPLHHVQGLDPRGRWVRCRFAAFPVVGHRVC